MRRAAVAVVGLAVVAAAAGLGWREARPRAAVALAAVGGERSAATASVAAVSARAARPAPTAGAESAPEAAAAAPTARASEDEDTASSDALAAVREAVRAGTEASTQALVRALDTDDSVAKLEALEELARRKHVAALDRVLAIDPADDPFAGPTALLTMGALARDAGEAAEGRAVARLSALLAAEKERQGTDSPGNILVAFEALGRIASDAAARVLERELVDPFHGTAARVAVVQALEECGRPRSVEPLVRLRASLHGEPVDAFERELQQDLVAAIDRAVVRLRDGG